jgi:hypothetical protein
MIFPVQAALPAAEAVAGNALSVARPLLGVGAAAAFLLAFKPLLSGLFRAVMLAVKPRQTLEERSERTRLHSILTLHRLADEYEETQPNLAAELRNFAGRG